MSPLRGMAALDLACLACASRANTNGVNKSRGKPVGGAGVYQAGSLEHHGPWHGRWRGTRSGKGAPAPAERSGRCGGVRAADR
jgi:hypothetical protein